MSMHWVFIFKVRYAGFCRLMAVENRLLILFSLEGGQKSVSSVIEATGLSQTLLSYH